MWQTKTGAQRPTSPSAKGESVVVEEIEGFTVKVAKAPEEAIELETKHKEEAK